MSEIAYQFRSRSILSFYKKSGKSHFRSLARQQSIEKFKRQKTYSGEVTPGSQKRLTRALENLISIAKPKEFSSKGKEYTFKVNFVTLTLYAFGRKIPGNEGHKTCLEPLLRWLRDSKGMKGYVWKAELQSKRKDCHQLHYHLVTDIYIDKFELRDKWNELQRKAGYLDYFFEKFGRWNPNSTDVHATHNKKNIIGYLKKKIVRYPEKNLYQHLKQQTKNRIIAEMAKNEQNKENIQGKVWDASYNVKTAYFEVLGYTNVSKRLASAVYYGEIEKKEFDHCTVYELTPGNNRTAADYIPYPERYFYNEYVEKMRSLERLKPDIAVFSSS